MTLSEVSIRRPVFAAMLVLALVVFGYISMGRLEMQIDPDMDYPMITVLTELHGASPATVEREVTDLLEERINSLEGIRSLNSISSQGLSQVFVEFALDYDPDIKAQEVRDRVALARADLPTDVEDPLVQKFDINAQAFMNIVLGGAISLRELSDLARHEVKERLERIDGVGAVTIVGAREREIRIWLDPLRLGGYGLSIEDVAGTLRRENAELASGRIEGADREWSLTTQGKARNVAEFGELIVAERAGRVVRLRDVAVVEDGMAEARTIARLNGQPGVALEIQPQSGADVVRSARLLRREIDTIRQRLPAGVQIAIARDYAVMIEEQVREVFRDMLFAAALVVAVVLCFLRNVRSTFIAALAIPSSVIASFSLFLLFGLTINTMTLMALALAIGLVIDDAIVVLESIYRRIEAGEAAIPAAIQGTREVELAVIATTLAVCGVFVPIVFMRSSMGLYFYEFGVAVTAAVCVSTLVALTLTPMLASRLLGPRTAHVQPALPFRLLERALDALEYGYRRLLTAAVRHRLITLGIAAAAVLGGCGIASTLPVNLMTREDLSELEVNVKLAVGTPLSVTDSVTRRIEEALVNHPYVRDVFAASGDERQHKPNHARIQVRLIPKEQRAIPIRETFGEVRELLLAAIPEAEQISVGFQEYGDTGDDIADLTYSVLGPDLDQLERFSSALAARMKADPDFTDVRTSHESGSPQITLEVDRGRAADLGVSAATIGETLRTLFAGDEVGSYEEGGHRHDVRVQVAPQYRNDPAQIHLVRVRSARGELVPVTNVARVVQEQGPVEIRRNARTREIRVYANMAPGASLGTGAAKLQRWAKEIGITPPFTLEPGGYARTMEDTGRDIAFAFTLALIAIYMILASLFDSLTHPLTIMTSAPLAFIGGFVALALSGLSMDMMAGIGLLVLMGLVMKNGILLVDYTTQLRTQGRSLEQAVLEAAPVRMRPVLMTSAALVIGMLPMVLSDAVGAEFRAPMGMITIGGLITSTLLTLVVVPVVYMVVDATSMRSRRAWSHLRGALASLPRRNRNPLHPRVSQGNERR